MVTKLASLCVSVSVGRVELIIDIAVGGVAPTIRVIHIWRRSEDERLQERIVPELQLLIFIISDKVLFIGLFKHELNYIHHGGGNRRG